MGNVKKRDWYYRRNTKRLVHMMTRFWLRERTRKALQGNYDEIMMLRYRLMLATQELNEWRWKVGGADYQMSGAQARALVDNGLTAKIGGGRLRIESVDQWQQALEPDERRS